MDDPTIMKLPRQIKIAGQTVKIKVGKLENAYGQYEHETRIIWISDTLKDPKTIISTLRHEVLEASLLISGVGWAEKYDQECIVRCVDEIFHPAWESLKL
jgi:hypothetical protein